jgi:hypothetical protein
MGVGETHMPQRSAAHLFRETALSLRPNLQDLAALAVPF